MRIIDRYISRSIITIFVSTILIFAFLYILIDLASNLNEIIDRKVPFEVLINYYGAFFPIIFVQTSPIACLIAVLLTFGKLNQNNEIIVLRSSGMNFWRITKPAFFIAFVISAGIFWVNERFVPQATLASESIRDENIILKIDSERKKKEKIKNMTFYGLKNRLYFIDAFDPNTFELERVTVITQDNNQRIIDKIIAVKGKWTGIAWKFFQCQITTYHPENMEVPEDIRFYEEKIMDIKESPQDFLKQRLDVNSMNLKQLYDYITRFSKSGAIKALNNLRVDLHQKIAFPFNNLVIVLVGLPIAMMTGRRKGLTFASLGIAIAIGFLFYVINAVGLAFGKGGLLPPFVSAWFATIVFFCCGYYLVKYKF